MDEHDRLQAELSVRMSEWETLQTELGEVATKEQMKEATSKVNIAYDRVDIVFPVSTGSRTSRDRFVLHANFRTAQPKMITIPDWKDRKGE